MLGPIDGRRAMAMIAFATLLNYPLIAAHGQSVMPTAAARQDRRQNNQGFPTRRVGGGTRDGHCGATSESPGSNVLIALMPENLVETVDALPTFYFYVPAIKDTKKVALEFVLRDEQDRLVYEKTFSGSREAGIIPLKLRSSANLPELAVGKNYRWYLSLICDSSDRSRDDVVDGWVRRIPANPQLAERLNSADPIEKAKIYGEAGLWYEAFATGAAIKRSRPSDIDANQTWQQLLQSVGLAEYGFLASTEVE